MIKLSPYTWQEVPGVDLLCTGYTVTALFAAESSEMLLVCSGCSHNAFVNYLQTPCNFTCSPQAISVELHGSRQTPPMNVILVDIRYDGTITNSVRCVSVFERFELILTSQKSVVISGT